MPIIALVFFSASRELAPVSAPTFCPGLAPFFSAPCPGSCFLKPVLPALPPGTLMLPAFCKVVLPFSKPLVAPPEVVEKFCAMLADDPPFCLDQLLLIYC